MLCRTPGLEDMSSDQVAPLGGAFVAVTGQSSATVPSQSPLSCLEIERRQLHTFNLPPELVDVILAARRPSMKTVYTCSWDKFVAWCGTRLIDPPPLQAKLSDVLLIVLSLVWQRLWAQLRVIFASIHLTLPTSQTNWFY